MLSEVFEVFQISTKNSKKPQSYKLKQKEKDWVQDINNQVRKRQDKQKRIQVSIRQNIPKNGTIGNYIFTFITRRIAKKYSNRLKSIVDKMAIK